MRLMIRLTYHLEYNEPMKALAQTDPTLAVPIMVRVNNLRINGRLVEDEIAVVNDQYPVFIFETGTGRAPIGIVDPDPYDGGIPVLHITGLTKVQSYGRPSRQELLWLSRNSASVAGILPVDVYVC